MSSSFEGMTSHSRAMQQAIDLSQRFACLSVPLLLIGEPGVGKQWLARQIHANCSRSSAPWLQLHCGALDHRSLLSQIHSASGGSLFLEDIDQASLAVQSEIVSLLEDQASADALSGSSLQATPRLIASTVFEPAELVSRELLRQDLFFLLCPATICIPPLRQRTQDLPSLVEHLLATAARMVAGNRTFAVTSELLAELVSYNWPGNLDQLQSCLRRAVLQADGPDLTIDIESDWLLDFELLSSRKGPQSQQLTQPEPAKVVGGTPVDNSSTALTNDLDVLTQHLVSRGILEADKAREPLHSYVVNQVEKELISQILDECEQVQTKAALRLGINRNTLHKKVKEYDLESVNSVK